MSSNSNAASRSNYSAHRRDPVRRAAYEQAMAEHGTRAGISDSMTDCQLAFVRSFDGPEIAGNVSRSPRRRHATSISG